MILGTPGVEISFDGEDRLAPPAADVVSLSMSSSPDKTLTHLIDELILSAGTHPIRVTMEAADLFLDVLDAPRFLTVQST